MREMATRAAPDSGTSESQAFTCVMTDFSTLNGLPTLADTYRVATLVEEMQLAGEVEGQEAQPSKGHCKRSVIIHEVARDV